MKRKLKKDDEVIVIAGRDKKKTGKITKILSNGKVLVSGVNRVKKHVKPNPQAGIEGGIIEKEAPIEISNIAIFNAASNKADRVGYDVDGSGKKIRIFKSDGKPIDG